MSLSKTLITTVEELVAGILLQEKNLNNAKFNEDYPSLADIIAKHPALPIDDARELMQRVINQFTLDILKGVKLSDFNKNLYDLINEPSKSVSIFRSNFLKYLIKVDENQRRTQAIDDLGYRSKHVGEVGQKIVITMKILRCSRVHAPGQYDFYSAIGITEDGNLFNFSPKENLNTTDGYTYKVSCKVKSHHVDDRLNGFNVTRVNYCKVLNTDEQISVDM